jgi:methylenetetrahydrofolate dehydrogenase (NADP+) / methenyltetrahydrofolate cyclohydrolase
MQLLDGKSCAAEIRTELSEIVRLRKLNGKKVPHLAAIIVGENGGSISYVNAKIAACEEIGFKSTLISFDKLISEKDLLQKISDLNEDENIDGFIVQLPLPSHINELKITQAIDPKKDVDGFHPQNLGNMMLNIPSFLPATPAGIIELLSRNKIETEGKNCVIIGRSNIVGMPLSIMLARNSNPGNCTVTLAHSKTKNLAEITKKADILIAALGKPEFITNEMVKDGAVVIDVGTTRVEDPSRERGWRLCGDVKFDEVAEKCSFITPVPGGIGPMTIASLMMNTLKALELQGK